jgi:hypothetical protein
MLEPDRAGRCSAAVVAELLPQLILDAEARRREWWLGLLKIVGLIALAAVCVVVAVAAVVVGARRR